MYNKKRFSNSINYVKDLPIGKYFFSSGKLHCSSEKVGVIPVPLYSTIVFDGEQ